MDKKVAIVTGGSSGIGKGLARVYGENGFRILITGRKEQPLKDTVKELSAEGVDIKYIVSDVSKKEDNQAMATFAITELGRIDVLINNAGMSMRALFKDLEVEVIDRLMDVNFRGTVYATKACIDEIIKNKGSVIGISSIAGFRGLPARAGYSASKFAMQGFLEVLRTEMLAFGVHVMIACPGFTASNIRNTALTKDGSAQSETPLEESKLMSAEECATIIYKAMVRKRRFSIMTFEGKMAVFLNKWIPGVMDKIIYNKFAKEPGSGFPKLK